MADIIVIVGADTVAVAVVLTAGMLGIGDAEAVGTRLFW
jgi:hypothetical protein